MTTNNADDPRPRPEQLPFVAPCKKLDTLAALNWIQAGWQDIKRAPRQSLTYGIVMLGISYFISIVTLLASDIYLFFALLSGFILMGPVLAIGLYSISYQIQNNIPPVLGYCLREGRRHLGNAIIFAAVLLIVFLIWARAAAMLHIFFPEQSHPDWRELLLFLGIGSAIGSIFVIIIFSSAAFSLPMIMDKKVDVVTAIVTSINAVLRNKLPMLVWGGIIVCCVLIGFVTAFLGLAILLPLIGHATWHAYQETIDASQWPDHD